MTSLEAGSVGSRSIMRRQSGNAPVQIERAPTEITQAERWIGKELNQQPEAPRPSIETFTHIPEAERREDQALMKRLKLEHALKSETSESQLRGELMETLLIREAASGKWFGDAVLPASEFDDRTNGVDSIVEWRADASDSALLKAYRLALDITSATDGETLADKLKKLKGGVEVKYLRSAVEKDQTGKFAERSLELPISIIGVNADLVTDIAQKAYRVGQTKAKAGQNPELDKAFLRAHPLRELLHEQMKAQVSLTLADMATSYLRGSREAYNRRAKRMSLEPVIVRLSKASKDFFEGISAENLSKGEYIPKFAALRKEILQSLGTEEAGRFINVMGILRHIDAELSEIKKTGPLSQVAPADDWRKASSTYRALTLT